MVLGGIIAAVFIVALRICDLTAACRIYYNGTEAWGRNGFDGIESLCRGVPGSELP